jgi:hypothetical protein
MPPHERPNILVKSVDRFSRNIIYGNEVIDMIISLGIEIMFFDTPTLNIRATDGRVDFDRLLAIAQGASDQISIRVKDSLQVRRENGMMTTSTPPFGTKSYVGLDGTYLEVNHEEYFIQAIIAMFHGDYTPNELMMFIRIYQLKFGDPNCTLTIYDDNFVNIDERYSIYYGTLASFANILNYFGISKRGSKWTGGSISYQWTRYIEPNIETFTTFINNSFDGQHIDPLRFVPDTLDGFDLIMDIV